MNIKAYPIAWAHDDALRTAAGRWQRRGLLAPAQRAAIEAAHPADYYRPVLLLRVGLFVATLLGVGSVVAALVAGPELHSTVFLCLLVMAGGIIGVELLIKNGRHYHSGVDEALLYSALLAWQILLSYIFSELAYYSNGYEYRHGFWLSAPLQWVRLLLLLGPLLLALVRYADPVVAIVAFGTALSLLANVLLQVGIGRLLLPFGVMLAAGALHYWLEKLPARADYFYYRSSALVLRTLALAAFYLAGNYLVVREGNAELLHGYRSYDLSPQVALAPVFYLFTAVIPLVYIYFGLVRHDRLLLLLGVLAVAFSIYTVRYYHAILPPEVAATVAGLLLIGLVLAALRYLRTPRHSLMAAADDEAAPHFNLESLVVAQTAHVPAAPTDAGFQFGGGQSGGGGAEGQF